MVYACSLCSEDGVKRCSGCHKAWYCGSECQKAHWVQHIFDCNPGRDITTADHLALSAHNNLLPEDPQTCEDYGFTRAFTAENRSKLLGLYIGLIERIGTKPQTVHKWRIKGSLVEGIKNAFSQLPEGHRGGYYPWFLEHQDLLDSSSGFTGPPDDQVLDGLRRSWVFTGGSATASKSEIEAAVENMPKHRRYCHHLYTLLLSQWHPGPVTALWIPFGFCACRTEEAEMGLGRLFMELIQRCSFDQFHAAYSSSSLPALFISHGLEIKNPHVLDVLSGTPAVNKSVWDLKQFVLQDEQTRPIPSVMVDYGFANCRTEAHRRDLMGVYKAFFAHRDADALKLHEAAIKGQLQEYVGSLLVLRPKKKYETLMKNPYPLPEY